MSVPRILSRLMSHRVIVLAGITLLAAAPAIGQQESAKGPESVRSSAAWYGVPLPAGLGNPHRPILDVSSIKPAPASVPPGEEGYRDLAGSAVRRNLEAIVGISRADRARGEKAWGRISGFRAGDETHAWVLPMARCCNRSDDREDRYLLPKDREDDVNSDSPGDHHAHRRFGLMLVTL